MTDARRAMNRRYRERRACGGHRWRRLRREASERDGCCLACGRRDDLSADHIIPLSMGGETSAENLQTLCRRCNVRKGSAVADYRHALHDFEAPTWYDMMTIHA